MHMSTRALSFGASCFQALAEDRRVVPQVGAVYSTRKLLIKSQSPQGQVVRDRYRMPLSGPNIQVSSTPLQLVSVLVLALSNLFQFPLGDPELSQAVVLQYVPTGRISVLSNLDAMPDRHMSEHSGQRLRDLDLPSRGGNSLGPSQS